MQKETKGRRTRRKIIDAATLVVMSKGFNNTSINDIIRASGVKKGSVYFHFPGKEEIGVAILKDAENHSREFMIRSAVGNTPEEKISSYLDAILQHQRASSFVGGCLFGNTALEMSDSNPRFLHITQDYFDFWAGFLTDLLLEMEPFDESDARAMAKFIIATIEGGIMLSRVSKSGEDLENCLDLLRRMLNIQ